MCAGGDVSLPKGEEDGQLHHSAAAVSGVLPEERSSGQPSDNGGLHPRTHTQGGSLVHLTHAQLFGLLVNGQILTHRHIIQFV